MFSVIKNRLVSTHAAKMMQLWKDRGAVTALEYGIIASVMAITLVVAFKNLGTALSPIFSNLETSI